MRKIKFVSTSSGALEIESSATTLEELITSGGLRSIGNIDNMRFKVRGAEDELDINSTLPTGDFVLFGSPSKIKSGGQV